MCSLAELENKCKQPDKIEWNYLNKTPEIKTNGKLYVVNRRR